jgi:hypothetical protein
MAAGRLLAQADNVWFQTAVSQTLSRVRDELAEDGSSVFEPPGETHTLVVPDDVERFIS